MSEYELVIPSNLDAEEQEIIEGLRDLADNQGKSVHKLAAKAIIEYLQREEDSGLE